MRNNNYPVKLFWAPFTEPVVSIYLGHVTSSFLSKKRRRRGMAGCHFALDVKRQSPGSSSCLIKNAEAHTSEEKGVQDDTKKVSHSPPQEDECTKGASLRRKARTCLRFLEKELQVKRARALPSRIVCGYLRSAIRSCFDDLNEVQELSVKTSMKLEKSYCRHCESGAVADRVEKWKKERFRVTEVDEDHLAQFRTQFGRNIDYGWNQGKFPYIPNGNACLGTRRSEGGTWIPGEFSDDCEVVSVVSAGKPRIVTLFSEKNSSILYPLHRALYGNLKRWGWLLVGSPTDKNVASLNGREYISVDYSSATDNIKTAYTRAAIEVLIKKSEGMSDDEKRALRVVGNLMLDGLPAESGQPMGSLMSFPLLCLINKTVVDLSLNDLLVEGKINFKEWSCHRCLINGDDLLTRDVSTGGLLQKIIAHGLKVGLIVNKEKTMVHAEKGEINSTLFLNGVQQKKFNCGALFMGRDEADVIGFSARSCITSGTFVTCIRRASAQLTRQRVKLTSPLPCNWFNKLHRDREIRDALRFVPSKGPEPTNPFPVVTKPEGYDLSREEEVAVISERVIRLRESGYRPGRTRVVTSSKGSFQSLRKAVRREKPGEDTILKCLARAWEKKNWGALKERMAPLVDVLPEHVCDQCSSGSAISRLVCEIRENKKRVNWRPSGGQVPGTELGDFTVL